MHSAPRLGLAMACMVGLAACSEPRVLRATLPEPTMPAVVSDAPGAPLPLVAVPTGEPPIVRESAASDTARTDEQPKPLPLNLP